jgi:hypothetical protein
MSTLVDRCPADMPINVLSAWYDGELHPDIARRVEAHVATCHACRHYLADLRVGDEAVRQQRADDVQDQIWQRLTQQIRATHRRAAMRPNAALLGGLGAGAVIAILFAVVLVSFLKGSNTTAPLSLAPTVPTHGTATTHPTTPAPTRTTPAFAAHRWTAVPGLNFALNIAFAPSDLTTGYACGPDAANDTRLDWSVSHDGGHTWSSPTATGLAGSTCGIAISPNDPRAIALTPSCAGCSYPIGALTSYLSRDAGQTWTPITPPAGKVDPAHVGMNDPTWVGADLYIQFFPNFGSSPTQPPLLAVSINGAPFTWTNDAPVAQRAGSDLEWEAFALGTTLYIFVNEYPAAPWLFKTSDRGATWQQVTFTGPVPRAEITPSPDGQTLFGTSEVSGNAVAVVSRDGGQTWQALPAAPGPVGALFPAPDGTLFTVAYFQNHNVIVELAAGGTAWTSLALSQEGILALTWDAGGHPATLWSPTAGAQALSGNGAHVIRVAHSSLPYAPGISAFGL